MDSAPRWMVVASYAFFVLAGCMLTLGCIALVAVWLR